MYCRRTQLLNISMFALRSNDVSQVLLRSTRDASHSDGLQWVPDGSSCQETGSSVESLVVKHEFLYFCSPRAELVFLLLKAFHAHWNTMLRVCSQKIFVWAPLEFRKNSGTMSFQHSRSSAECIFFPDMEHRCHHPTPLLPVIRHMTISCLSDHRRL